MKLFSRHDRKQQRLSRLPAFSDIPSKQLKQSARVLDIVQASSGDVLVRQGAAGTEFYLVVEGIARVVRDGHLIGHVGPGDVLGEQALIGPGRRNATVVAETDMVLATATRPYFAGLAADVPSFGEQVRRAVAQRTQPDGDQVPA